MNLLETFVQKTAEEILKVDVEKCFLDVQKPSTSDSGLVQTGYDSYCQKKGHQGH